MVGVNAFFVKGNFCDRIGYIKDNEANSKDKCLSIHLKWVDSILREPFYFMQMFCPN